MSLILYYSQKCENRIEFFDWQAWDSLPLLFSPSIPMAPFLPVFDSSKVPLLIHTSQLGEAATSILLRLSYSPIAMVLNLG